MEARISPPNGVPLRLRTPGRVSRLEASTAMTQMMTSSPDLRTMRSKAGCSGQILQSLPSRWKRKGASRHWVQSRHSPLIDPSRGETPWTFCTGRTSNKDLSEEILYRADPSARCFAITKGLLAISNNWASISAGLSKSDFAFGSGLTSLAI